MTLLVNQHTNLHGDPAYMHRRLHQSTGPSDYVFAKKHAQCSPGTVPFEECEYVHRPVGDRLVETETALRFGVPFAQYDPKIKVASTPLFDHSVLKLKEGFEKRIDLDTTLTRAPQASLHGIRERGVLNERFGTGMLNPPTNIQYGACDNLYSHLSVEPRILHVGEATRVDSRNHDFTHDASKQARLQGMHNVKPANGSEDVYRFNKRR
jgi:hypothetical protein